MSKHIIIHDDFVEVLYDGHNIVENTIYDDEIVKKANGLLEDIKEVANA